MLSSTSTLEVYKVSILDDGLETEGFHIIIGTKKDGDCIGISPDMLYPLGSSWQSTQSSRCSEPLKLEIKTSVRSVGEDILLLSHYKNT